MCSYPQSGLLFASCRTFSTISGEMGFLPRFFCPSLTLLYFASTRSEYHFRIVPGAHVGSMVASRKSFRSLPFQARRRLSESLRGTLHTVQAWVTRKRIGNFLSGKESENIQFSLHCFEGRELQDAGKPSLKSGGIPYFFYIIFFLPVLLRSLIHSVPEKLSLFDKSRIIHEEYSAECRNINRILFEILQKHCLTLDRSLISGWSRRSGGCAAQFGAETPPPSGS